LSGNVRELERAIERAVTLVDADVIELEDLPPSVRREYSAALGPSLTHNETLRAWARRYARLVVQRYGGNKRAASRALGISYHTLHAYVKASRYDDNPDAAGDADVDSIMETPSDAEATDVGSDVERAV
jgi:DNA-binding NtrC family response regulator